ncbi:hypothetical protein [Agromyces sp. Root81]|uniref:hypothetical protein n=1 Tax=Agromyces sp. Root81 TaxID=1736601 RepID=UPI000AF98517|nr:hypothetical protein [Agromyces sp. Root81]
MTDDLDELLRRSQPELAERSPNLTFALDDLVSAHPVTVKRRWRPMIAGSFIVFALAGGASIAAATPGVLAWFGWTDNTTSYSRGEELCNEGFRVVSASKQDSDSDSLHAAREYLATLDIRAVDISAQLAEQIQDGGGPRNPESVARSTAIYELTVEHVASLGLPTKDLSIESGGLCDGGER